MAPEYLLYIPPEIVDGFEKIILQVDGIKILDKKSGVEDLAREVKASLSTVNENFTFKDLSLYRWGLTESIPALSKWFDFVRGLDRPKKLLITRILNISSLKNMTLKEVRDFDWSQAHHYEGVGALGKKFLQVVFGTTSS